MTKYVNSSEAVTSNLMLWDPIHTQTSIVETNVFEYYPQTAIDYSDTISFLLKGHSKLMIENIEIISEIRILTANDQAPAANVNVSVVSNLANALWRSVECVVGGQNLIQSFDNSYNIGAWFDIVLNSGPDREDYLWLKESFLMDSVSTKAQSEDTTFYPVAPDGDRPVPAVVNKSGQTRANKIAQGSRVVLISDLNCSLFKQGKLLPTNLDVRISLTKNYDGYILLEAAETHKVHFDKCLLRVTMRQPNDFCLHLMELKLQSQPAVYQAEKGMISFHSIPTGNEQITFNNIFSGTLPVLFVFAVQERTAYGKTRNKNPYTFKPMKRVQVYVDGKEHFPRALEGDNILFDSLYQTIGYKNSGSCLISSANFGAHPMIAVDLTADRSANRHHLNLSRTGEVKINIELPEVAEDGLILVVYAYYDRIIEINSDRNVREL